jgi:hypothetical protein
MATENDAAAESPQINAGGGTPPPSAQGTRRGPGRPRKDAGAVPPLGETPIGGEAPKRGRPKKERVELDKAAVARQLMGSHMTMAMFLGLPELALTQAQAEQMADVLCDFSREYDWDPDPKVMATLNLVATAGFVYVPKVAAIVARVKATKAKRGQVIDGEAVEVKNDGGASAH